MVTIKSEKKRSRNYSYRILNIEIHPEKMNNFDKKMLIGAFKNYDKESAFVQDRKITCQGNKNAYISVSFRTNKLAMLWLDIQANLMKKGISGMPIKDASIIVCEGEKSWDDYLLLHHYDQKVKLDKLTKMRTGSQRYGDSPRRGDRANRK
ncbi:MAG: hypothetical protein HGA80_08120 [Candidatus Omnitrophica bacterium]|nr:hypothetical protein [Candidatus Omnitrophota bacterium]